MLVSQLYALAHGVECSGPDECYWCGAPCERHVPHNQPPPSPFQQRNTFLVRRPGNAYICRACQLWRRPRITVTFLGGGYQDNQTPSQHGWWLTEREALAIHIEEKPSNGINGSKDAAVLYKLLLKPPVRFALLLSHRGTPNHLQKGLLNDFDKPAALETSLHYTLDNTAQIYTPYELQQALNHGSTGREPGTRLLIELLGRPKGYEVKPAADPAKTVTGRPASTQDAKSLKRSAR